ncbi:MAG: CHRD domain-containing protein [Leptolyngbyaceae bacterium]|nr:CHRD domain-containing protein [Leptolyngbyaceae bacterium]
MTMKLMYRSLGFAVSAAVVGLGLALPQAAHAGHTNPVLATMLEGTAIMPMAGDPEGMGHGYVFGIDGDETTLCYVLEVSDIQLVPVGEGMAAHIHEGVMGSNGPVVAALAGPEDGNAGDCLTEGEEGKFPTGEMGIVQRILNNPENFYINVHNPEFPDGAIRGQLSGPDHSH